MDLIKSTAPKDLLWACPGENFRRLSDDELGEVMPVRSVPVYDFASLVPVQSWRAQFWDDVASAVLLVALGAVGGIIVTALVVLRILAGAQ